MKSKIYEGTIEHRRFWPVAHHLSYPIYLYGFDLSELEMLNQRYPVFGYNRFAVTSLYDRDYLAPGNLPVRHKVSRLLKQHQIDTPINSVFTITSARHLNYVFNPVSFHYCFSTDRKLAAVIAEVNNTYGERHPYVLPGNRSTQDGIFATFQTKKVFHVSPFNKVEGTYHFYVTEPGDRIEIRIELVNDNKKIMAATLKACGRPLTPVNHVKTMLKHPITPHLNIPRIYTQAFKLFFRKKLIFNDKPVPTDIMTLKKQTPRLMENVCRRIAFTVLKRIKHGCLMMEMPDGKVATFGNPKAHKNATIKINDFRFFPRIVFNGDIGMGESYMASEWDTPDLVGLAALLIRNRDCFSDGNLVFSLATRIKEKAAHARRTNTIEKTPENIREHYDLSNAFYSLFLDQQMLYSCAIFAHKDDTLEAAQKIKMKRIITQAGICEDHHILEIGCGWGGFAVFAAKQTGCTVTGITVSKAQYNKAVQRVKDEGLEDKITILLQDYRHTTGKFDRIVSIEMIEAVGPQFFPAYFKQAQTLLTPGGKMVFQAIIIADERYERYCRERDWIQKHIFPGGHLPCLKVLRNTLSTHTNFKLADVYHMGHHYATTLSHWHKRFTRNTEEIARMGFDETFCRKWRYYFSICEAGFTVGGIDDIQVTLTL